MSLERRDPPRTRRALEQLIRNLAREAATLTATNRRRTGSSEQCSTSLVSQMVPDGVVKGGTAMKLRIEAGSRFTPDFDAARPRTLDLDGYLDLFADRLEEG